MSRVALQNLAVANFRLSIPQLRGGSDDFNTLALDIKDAELLDRPKVATVVAFER